MITREIVQEKAGLTRSQLAYLRHLRLIGEPTFRPTSGRGGGVGEYPDDTLYRIDVIQHMQREGMTLMEIAEELRGAKVAMATNGEFPSGAKAEELSNPDDLAATFRLMDRLKASFRTTSLIRIEFEHIERDGQRIVRVPVVVYR